MEFWKKDANFEENIAKIRQITKLIDKWGKNLQKSQQQKKLRKLLQNVWQCFIQGKVPHSDH